MYSNCSKKGEYLLEGIRIYFIDELLFMMILE